MLWKFTRNIILVVFVTKIACLAGISETAGSLSDSKFISRIERKQESLVCMEKDIDDLRALRIKCESKNTEDEKALLSDSKWLTRLEHKLGAIVNDSIKDTECSRQMVPRPAFNGMVVPKSRFEKEPAEKEE